MSNEQAYVPHDISTYVCADCGVSGVKLWRLYEYSMSPIICFHCVQRITHEHFPPNDLEVRGYEIHWWVPAIPAEDTDSYWDYTSVTNAGIAWWKSLLTATESRRQ